MTPDHEIAALRAAHAASLDHLAAEAARDELAARLAALGAR